MPLKVTRTEGVTVYTITPNPKSDCPLIFLLLHTLCCRPVCFESRNLKQQLGTTYTVLGVLQILVGVMNVGFGSFEMCNIACISLGALLTAAGIICIIVGKFPSQYMFGFTAIMNLNSANLALTAIELYIADLIWMSRQYGNNVKMVQGGLKIILILLCVLQLCVTVIWCVLSMQALFEKKKGVMMVRYVSIEIPKEPRQLGEDLHGGVGQDYSRDLCWPDQDPEFQKPLLVDVLTSPAC